MNTKKAFLILFFCLLALSLLFFAADTYLKKDEGRTEEVLSSEGKTLVARVLTPSGIPFEPSYSWVYLIRDGEKVFVWDSGTRYSLLLPSLIRCHTSLIKPLKSEEYIMKALNKYFPNTPIEAIGLSHWHWDHSENAPFLQAKLNSPILINKEDKASAEKVFKGACFEGSALFGEELKNGFKLGSSSFFVLETPGHTKGTVSLVSDEFKMVIANASYSKCFKDEENTQDGACKILSAYHNYKVYYLHPGF